MSIIFITHDISIVGNICDKLVVLYGGIVVETGLKDQILKNPQHPYTEALLKAIPILGDKKDRLHTIKGEPPDAGNLPSGCPFHPRCDYAKDICKEGEPPPVVQMKDGRQARCWILDRE